MKDLPLPPLTSNLHKNLHPFLRPHAYSCTGFFSRSCLTFISTLASFLASSSKGGGLWLNSQYGDHYCLLRGALPEHKPGVALGQPHRALQQPQGGADSHHHVNLSLLFHTFQPHSPTPSTPSALPAAAFLVLLPHVVVQGAGCRLHSTGIS